jgi:hypothetical protein
MSLNFSETPFTYGICISHRTQSHYLFARKTAALPVNNRVNETLGIIVLLMIKSEATNFIIQVLAFLAYGGSSFVKALN